MACDWFGDDQVVRIEGPCVCGHLSMLECDVAAVEVAVVMRSLDVDAAVAAADSAQTLPLPPPGSCGVTDSCRACAVLKVLQGYDARRDV